ncbi:hypothetical protein GQ600_17677 [Phytophthora cactorum]|nr:hypothetical protein GQ600_17677 [Phytophthora cactorum]
MDREAVEYSLSESDNGDDYEYESESEEGFEEESTEHTERHIAHLQQDGSDLLIMEHPVRFSALDEARAALDGFENPRFSCELKWKLYHCLFVHSIR